MAAEPGVFVLREDGSLVGLTEAPYDSEALLQELLASHPSLLAGSQIDSAKPRRWLLVTRELGIPDDVGAADRWSVDHLFIDQDGVPTLVEVKRASDTRIRREVVGQMLDYAANAVVYWPIEAIREEFKARCASEKVAPDDELLRFLGSDADPEEFWVQVKTNLQAGRVRLLFVADAIPVELKRVVEFLNQQMDPAEVLAIEVRNYVGSGIRSLAPRVFGLTAQAEQAKSAGGTRRGPSWTEATFFAKLSERNVPAEGATARRLFEWAAAHVTRIEYGQGTTQASFIPVLTVGDSWFGPFRVFSGYRAAYVEIPLGGSGMRVPPFDNAEQRRELVKRLNAIGGVRLADDVSRFPSIDIATLAVDSRLEKFLQVMDWAVASVSERST